MDLKKSLSLILIISIMISILSWVGFPAEKVESKQTISTESVDPISAKQTCFFTENKGQWDQDILFVGNTSFGKVAFTQDGIYYRFIKATEQNQTQNHPAISLYEKPSVKSETHTIALSFVDHQKPTVQGNHMLPSYHNYFLGEVSAKWTKRCRNYSSITYQNIWSGVDLVYSFQSNQLQYRFEVDSDADKNLIQLKVTGADIIQRNNLIEMKTPLGSLYDHTLAMTQEGVLSVSDRLFSAPSLQPKTNLLGYVGWETLEYSTFLGGSSIDYSHSIAVDQQGNAYITGDTYSADFPMSITVGGGSPAPGYDQTIDLATDVFVTKLNAAGTQILYSTFLGGSFFDYGYDIDVDDQGNAYITGSTSLPPPPPDEESLKNEPKDYDALMSDFPMDSFIGGSPAPGYDKTISGYYSDAFVIKLNSTGTELIYATYLGGDNASDFGFSLVLDSQNNAYIAGETFSNDFPLGVTLNGPQAPGYDSTYNGIIDFFIVKLDPSGTQLHYSTYLGGDDFDMRPSIDLDSNGNVYLTGTTLSANFPMESTLGGLQAPGFNQISNGGEEVVIVKLNSTGTELLYSTFIGGEDIDEGASIAVDSQGCAYITGMTYSYAFPKQFNESIVPGYIRSGNTLSQDAYIVKMNATGTDLVYWSFFGGERLDIGHSIAVDSIGCAYITGETEAEYFDNIFFPMTETCPPEICSTSTSPLSPGYDKNFNLSLIGVRTDAFFIKFDPTGVRNLYSTFLGGVDDDIGIALALDVHGNAYITGQTNCSDFPMTITHDGTQLAPGYDKTYNNGYLDTFVVKLPTQNSYTVFASVSGPGGSVNPASQEVGKGTNASIDINPDKGYRIASIMDNGVEMPIQKPYIIQNIQENHTVVVMFEIGYYSVTAEVSGGHGTVAPSDQMVYQGDNATVFITPDLGYRVHSITDNGYYKQLTNPNFPFNYLIVNVNEDHHVVVTFEVKPKPALSISVELNKKLFCYGDEVIYKVTIHNSGGDATLTVLQVTLPEEVQYESCDRYLGYKQGAPNTVVFNIGAIEANSQISFQIFARVASKVNFEKSSATFFYVYCREGSNDESVVFFTIKQCGGGNPVPYIKAVLLNTKMDPETGERYIDQKSDLQMEVTVDGFTPPYKIEIFWGDGEKDLLEKQSEKTLQMKHLYSSSGIMEIKVRVEDASGKSKEVSIRIRVK